MRVQTFQNKNYRWAFTYQFFRLCVTGVHPCTVRVRSFFSDTDVIRTCTMDKACLSKAETKGVLLSRPVPGIYPCHFVHVI